MPYVTFAGQKMWVPEGSPGLPSAQAAPQEQLTDEERLVQDPGFADALRQRLAAAQAAPPQRTPQDMALDPRRAAAAAFQQDPGLLQSTQFADAFKERSQGTRAGQDLYTQNISESQSIDDIQPFIDQTWDFFTKDREGFDQWAQENPLWATRFFANISAAGQQESNIENVGQNVSFGANRSGIDLGFDDQDLIDAFGREFLEDSGMLSPENTGEGNTIQNPYADNPYDLGWQDFQELAAQYSGGTASDFSTSDFKDINNPYGADFFKIGDPSNTSRHGSLLDYVSQNPLETAGLAAAAFAAPGIIGATGLTGAGAGAATGALGSAAGSLITGNTENLLGDALKAGLLGGASGAFGGAMESAFPEFDPRISLSPQPGELGPPPVSTGLPNLGDLGRIRDMIEGSPQFDPQYTEHILGGPLSPSEGGGGGGGATAGGAPASSAEATTEPSTEGDSKEDFWIGDLHDEIGNSSGALRDSLISEYNQYANEPYDAQSRPETNPEPFETSTEQPPPTPNEDLPQGYEWVMKAGEWFLENSREGTSESQHDVQEAIFADVFGEGALGDTTGDLGGPGTDPGGDLGFGGGFEIGEGPRGGSGQGPGSGSGTGGGSGSGEGEGEGDDKGTQDTPIADSLTASLGGRGRDRIPLTSAADVRRINTRPLLWDFLRNSQ